jgi:DNA (cytosine-5)-methyltransferase 1
MTTLTKPPYAVPSMADIAAVPWNGLNAISTFSGAGGSSLGYKMAGFKVLWASEFVEAARNTYAANAPDTILDDRDIRSVSPQSILDAIGMKPGDLDLLDGSPPCASFSMAGNRSRDWGKTKAYSDTAQRTDDLFFEFIRILDGIQPRVFVAENVSGLLKGVAKGYFLEILAAMKACGYNVKVKLLNAQWLGVPQFRQRVFFIGLRNDQKGQPTHPKPLAYSYTVRDALPWINAFQRGGGFGETSIASSDNYPYMTIGATPGTGNGRATKVIHDTHGLWGLGDVTDRVAPTIMTASGHLLVQGETSDDPKKVRKFTIAELRRICGFPDDFILTGSYSQQWERLGRSVPPVMMKHIATTTAEMLCSA